MIKAVVFNWHGVLIEDPHPKIVEYCVDKLDVSMESFRDALNKHLPDFQRGSPEVAFWKNMAGELGIKPPKGSLWGEAFEYAHKENNEMWQLARELKSVGYKIGIMSNADEPSVEFFNSQRYDVFDATTFSNAEMVRQPDQMIYKVMLSKLNVKPKHVLYIDHRKDHVEEARKAGFHAIHYRNHEQLRQDLLEHSVEI